MSSLRPERHDIQLPEYNWMAIATLMVLATTVVVVLLTGGSPSASATQPSVTALPAIHNTAAPITLP